MRLIGHRGALALAPENTLRAIRAGFAAGADAAEIDVRLSADGRLMVIHDEALRRTTGAEGEVADRTADELRLLNAAAGRSDGAEPIPFLEEAWDAADGALVIEIKGSWPGDLGTRSAAVVAELLASRDHSRAIVSSFDLIALTWLKQSAPSIRTGVLTHEAVDAASNVACAVDGGHEVCFLPFAAVTKPIVAAAHAESKLVIPWTVNGAGALRSMVDAGCDGVITDDPGAARLIVLGSSSGENA